MDPKWSILLLVIRCIIGLVVTHSFLLNLKSYLIILCSVYNGYSTIHAVAYPGIRKGGGGKNLKSFFFGFQYFKGRPSSENSR